MYCQDIFLTSKNHSLNPAQELYIVFQKPYIETYIIIIDETKYISWILRCCKEPMKT